jgi:hypothetical protein
MREVGNGIGSWVRLSLGMRCKIDHRLPPAPHRRPVTSIGRTGRAANATNVLRCGVGVILGSGVPRQRLASPVNECELVS